MAQNLTNSDKPGEALALIDKIRGPVPPQTQILNPACEEQRLNAVIKAQELAQKAQPATPNRAQQASSDWDRFTKDWATPLASMGQALLGLILFFLVLGRLLAFVPKMPWGKMTSGQRLVLLLSGLGLILIGSAGIIWGLGRAAANVDAVDIWMIAGGCLFALWGAVFLAFYLSSRLRIALEVRGPDGSANAADTAHVAALLHELGAAPPRGLEIPQGTDVSALGDTALTVTLSNKVLAAAQKVLTSIFGVTPWRAVVSAADENSLTVAMTRNGWAVGAATIDRKELGLSGEASGGAASAGRGAVANVRANAELELHKLAAAFVLATLAGKHHGFDGLCGATDWRSLGLHYIATTGDWADSGPGETLLGKAVGLDPGNMLAEVAFQHRMFRPATDAKTLHAYAEWLLTKAAAIRSDVELGTKSAAGYTCLLYRIEMTFLSVVLNLPVTDEFKPLRSRARVTAHEVLDSLEPGGHAPVPGPLAQAMRLHAALAYHDLFGAGIGADAEAETEAGATAETGASAEVDAGARAWAKISAPAQGKRVPHFVQWYEEALASIAPDTAYDAACSIARKGGLASEQNVMDRLEYAFTNPENKDWARLDPEFTELRTSAKFRHFLGLKPRRDFWKLEPFVPFEKQLRGAGVARPGDLTGAPVGPHDIRVYLQLSPLEFERLVRLASLVRRAESVAYSGQTSWQIYEYRVEVVGALLQAGIESPEEIEDPWIDDEASDTAGPHNPRGFIEELRKSILQRIMDAPDAGPLKAWLRELKAPARVPPSGVESRAIG